MQMQALKCTRETHIGETHKSEPAFAGAKTAPKRNAPDPGELAAPAPSAAAAPSPRRGTGNAVSKSTWRVA